MSSNAQVSNRERRVEECGGALSRPPAELAVRGLDAEGLAGIQASLCPAGCSSILVGEVGAEGVRILATNRPRGWTETYLERAYHRVCPVASRLHDRSRPHAWSEILASRALDGREQEVVDHARHHGMREGYIVPVAATDGVVGFVSFAGPSMEMNGVLRNRLGALATRLYGECARDDDRAPRLTPREAEILLWIANGKSDWQIGRILSISAKTVNYHVENAKRKFAVATRVQAVVRAVLTGQVTC